MLEMVKSADKVVIVNLRVPKEVRDNFRIAAKLRGSSMSGLLHQFIIRTVREEKEQEPAAFEKPAPRPVKVTSSKRVPVRLMNQNEIEIKGGKVTRKNEDEEGENIN